MLRLGVIGARGHVGAELIGLVAKHPGISLELATSSEAKGRRVRDVVPAADTDIVFESPEPADVAGRGLDVLVLGLPNGQSDPWVHAIDAASPRTLIVDLGADHRFDDAWIYGQPERRRASLRDAKRIANPGCYATAAQLAIEPIATLVTGPITVFGVSGYSGAGATPSKRNDPEMLRDNLLPYALVDHTHEKELRRQLGLEIDFLPHVAPFFRGLSVTVSFRLAAKATRATLWARFLECYAGERLVRLSEEAPLVRDAVGRHEVSIGGLEVSSDGRRGAIVATLDNLLGGAATQALRNVNLASGREELEGIA